MTTSGVYSIQYTRDQLLTAAMRKMGVLAQGQVPNSDNLNDGTLNLNMAIAAMRGHGMPLWERTSYTFSSVSGQQSYQFGTVYNSMPYPLKLLQLYRTDSTAVRIDMEIEGDYNFNQLPISSTGIPIKGTYQPFVNYGVLKLWPTPDATAVSSTFTIVYQQPFQYFINASDTADFPEEWYIPLVYQTAMLWAPEWGVPLADRSKLTEEFAMYLNQVLSMGGEDASMFIQPYFQP